MTALISMRDNLRWSKLHLITDLGAGRGVAAHDLPRFIGDLYDAGVDVIELRDQALGEQRALVEQVHAVAFDRRRLLVLGRDLQAAAAQQADVLHLGASDGDLTAARRRLHEYALVGRSVHNPAQWDHAAREADYAYVGPVFAEQGQAPGLELVRYAAQQSGDDFVWVAVGGITASNLDQVLEAGARRVAVSAAIVGAKDPVAAAGALADTLRERLGPVGLTAHD
ncbi:thiamine phosphate synthase [Aestuariimicrobium kwangyangense]|uniref:thiamine phosphate synthase n=1 Tax=Aestuariimicrobium kwangyangense TaxID=396389 RepID=UPI0003B712D5|nr:thiamine phosphate synthase [Aestuariimicrobium kwangyangense]